MWLGKRGTKKTLYLTNFSQVILLMLFIVSIIIFSSNYAFHVLLTDLTGVILKGKSDTGFPVDIDARLVEMGITDDCDDGEKNLTVDWDHSPKDYTCMGSTIPADPRVVPKYECEPIPKNYKAEHICMSETINYSKPLPTFGKHRPLWPVYGEYKYLPVQRWLHSLEHGGIVMLYHPCADSLEINTLKRIVKKCLRRYIISPSNLLDKKRPLALLAWGCQMTMSFIKQSAVEEFIQKHALHGSEITGIHGDFNDQLLEASMIVSDYDDINLCPEKNLY